MKKNKSKKVSKGINWKVVIYSVLGLICVILSFKIDFAFLLPAVVFMLLNQRELSKKR